MNKIEFIKILQEILDKDGRLVLGRDTYKICERLLIEKFTNYDYDFIYKIYNGYGDTIHDVIKYNTLEELVEEYLSDNLDYYTVYTVFKMEG